jgi:hypothetical protein
MTNLVKVVECILRFIILMMSKSMNLQLEETPE